MASGWLQVGAVGPWRISIHGADGVPSASAEPLPNADTWLDFTDLVFIDPPGTGYSRILAKGDAARRRFWSVNGDIDALAEAVRRWLDQAGRSFLPNIFLAKVMADSAARGWRGRCSPIRASGSAASC